jgi:hypothetical protein
MTALPSVEIAPGRAEIAASRAELAPSRPAVEGFLAFGSPGLRNTYALERRTLLRPRPRRRAFVRSGLRAGFPVPLPPVRPRWPRRVGWVAVAASFAAFATDFALASPRFPPRRDFFQARRAITASLRACRDSRRASLKRLRARFNCSLASRICWRATSARNFAVAKDSAGASSPCSFTSGCPLRSIVCYRAARKTAPGGKSLPDFCDGVTALARFVRSPGAPAAASLSTEPVHNSVYKRRRTVTRSQKHRRYARRRWIERFLISSHRERAAIAAGSTRVIKTAPHECRLALLPLLLLLLAERHRRLAGTLQVEIQRTDFPKNRQPTGGFLFSPAGGPQWSRP